MKLIIDKELEFIPSREFFLDSFSPDNENAVVFEINKDTACFYSLNWKGSKKGILDALHIYDIKSLTERDKILTIKIDWSENSRFAVLFINNNAQAIFDFIDKQGHCLTGFPQGPSKSGWSKKIRSWDDKLMEIFTHQ